MFNRISFYFKIDTSYKLLFYSYAFDDDIKYKRSIGK